MFAISIGVLCALMLIIRVLNVWVPKVARNLLLRPRILALSSTDYGAILALAFFLGTFTASVMWFGYLYDTSTIAVPTWTGVFG